MIVLSLSSGKLSRISVLRRPVPGFPWFLKLRRCSGLFADLPGRDDCLQGWTATQRLTALVLMNMVGLDCVSDAGRLEEDKWIESHRRVVPAGPRPHLPSLGVALAPVGQLAPESTL